MNREGVWCLLILLGSNTMISAHPYFWIADQDLSDPDPLYSLTCYDYPHINVKYQQHGVVEVSQDSATFVMAFLNGTTTQTVCPGVVHSLKVTFQNDSQGLLVASAGAFKEPYTGLNSQGCANRVVLSDPDDEDAVFTNFTQQLTLPCDAAVLSLVVTSAMYEGDSLMQSTATFLVDPSCAAQSCSLPRPPPPAANDGAGGAPPPANPSPAPQPEPPAPAPPLPAPPSPPLPTCTPSILGYQCMGQLGELVLHWSVGVAPPAAHMTGQQGSRRLLLPDASGVNVSDADAVHIAAVGQTTGYVGVGFTDNPGKMPHTDIVLGWVAADGTAMVDTFHAHHSDLDLADRVSPSWAYNLGVQQSGGATTVRFSRALSSALAETSPTLDASGGTQLNWALGAPDQTSFTMHESAGGGVVTLMSGSISGESTEHSDFSDWIRAHGSLMTLGWMVLLPLGTLVPAHSWVFQEARWGAKHVWFVLHVVFQLAGTAVCAIAFIICFTTFPEGTLPGGTAGQVHKILGIVVMSLAAAQVLIGFVRPSPDAGRLRSYWNLAHHNLGRLAILAGWTACYLGAYIFSVSAYKEPLGAWVAPLLVMNLAVILLGVILYCVRKQVTGGTSSSMAQKGLLFGHGPSSAGPPASGLPVSRGLMEMASNTLGLRDAPKQTSNHEPRARLAKTSDTFLPSSSSDKPRGGAKATRDSESGMMSLDSGELQI